VAVSPAIVASPAQVRAILTQVSRIKPELAAFFGCLDYAALRPEEAVTLRRAPASGIPAIPHHAPSADAAAASARQSRPNSATATTDPRASPPRGSSPRSAGSTGSAPA
jgi:hypothetical protein